MRISSIDVVRDLRFLVQHQFRKEEQLLDQLNKLSQQQAPTKAMKMKEFLGLDPPSFDGTRDPMKEKLFILELEKIYKVLQCSEEEKVNFAVFMLKGKACIRWHVEETLLKHEVRDWGTFKLAFSRNYFHMNFRTKMWLNLVGLKMDECMSVGEYQDALESMAIFRMPSESAMTSYFLLGLKPKIKQKLVESAQVEGSYAEMVEQVLADVDEQEDDYGRKRPRSPSLMGHSTCPRCSRYLHDRECRWCSGSCFKCGARGHKKVHCPENV